MQEEQQDLNTLESPVHNGASFDSVYTLEEELGSGNFSVVRKCTHKETGQSYAVKCINKATFNSPKELAMFRSEVKIMSVIKHPHVVRLHETFESKDTYFLVLELITGGELFDRIVSLKKYTEVDASRIVAQMVGAIKDMWDQRIVHRDLKPENLLLLGEDPSSDVKIADFGLATFHDPAEKLFHAVGTPGYIAPEILLCLEDEPEGYGLEVDMWSVGVITYILLCGFPPFYAEDEDDLYDSIIDGDWSFVSPYWDKVSENAKDLISKLLITDPAERATPEQVLAHPWIKDHEALPQHSLVSAVEELKKWNAKRKWKAAILATIATNRMRNKLDRLKIIRKKAQEGIAKEDK